MKTHEITLGGVMTALLLVVSYIWGNSSRSTQTMIDLVRIIIVAFYVHGRTWKPIFFYSVASLTLSLIFLPPQIAVINITSSLFLGILVGKMIMRHNVILGTLAVFLGNVVAFIYTVFLYRAFTGINLLQLYKSEYTGITNFASNFNGRLYSMLTPLLNSIDVIVIVMLGIDLLLSSAFVYIVSQLITQRLDSIFMHYSSS